jgi:riboflavin transporter FmnP
MSETQLTVKADSRVARKIMIRRIASCAILSALAAILMYLEIAPSLLLLPFPDFLKFDFSEIPVLIGTFALGPVWGVVIELIKNLLHLPASGTMGVGELSNFLTGSIFVLTAGLIYRKVRTKKGAAISMVIATVVLSAASVPVNYFINLPFYAKAFNLPLEQVIAMSAKVNPLVKDTVSLLLAVFVPFNLIKGTLVSFVTFYVYKPISKLINKTYDQTHVKAKSEKTEN